MERKQIVGYMCSWWKEISCWIDNVIGENFEVICGLEACSRWKAWWKKLLLVALGILFLYARDY